MALKAGCCLTDLLLYPAAPTPTPPAQLLMRFPQPALRALNVQGQLFVNGGNCVQLTGKSGQEGALGAGIAG